MEDLPKDPKTAELPQPAFFAEPIDWLFSANDCVVIRTDQAAVFKIGNATESGMSITFREEPL